MENNTHTMTAATQSYFVAPSVVAVRLRAVAVAHDGVNGVAHAAATNAAAVWTDAALMVAKVRLCIATTIRAISGPVAWSPPTC